MKDGTEVTLTFSSNVVGDSNDETNFPHKLFLTDTQVLRFPKAFANYSSANAKLLKTKFAKKVQSGGFLGEYGGALRDTVLRAGLEAVKRGARILADKEQNISRIREWMKKFGTSEDSGISVTNNEIKDIIKVIISLDNRIPL